MTPDFLVVGSDCGGNFESGLASPSFSLDASGLHSLRSVSCFGMLKGFCVVGPGLVDCFSLDPELAEGNSGEKLGGGPSLSWDADPKLGIGFAGAGVVAVAVDGKDSLV